MEGLIGFALVLFGLWVLSVELRLKAFKILGEIVQDDMHERGKAPSRELSRG